MAHKRFTVQVDERGRFVLPAFARRCLDVAQGGVIVIDVETDEQSLQLRRASDVADAARGLLRDLVPGADLAAELIEDRRAQAERESAPELAQH